MTLFLSVGECMIEFSQTGEPGLFRRGFAGDTFNTAYYMRQLLPAPWEVGYVTAVGRDAASDELLAFVAAQGVETSRVARRDDRTVGLYQISLDEGERHFSYWRSASAARTLADDPGWLADRLSGATAVHVSGITLAIVGPNGRRNLLDALQAAKAGGALVSFDPNIRIGLWEDEATCQDICRTAMDLADVTLMSDADEVLLPPPSLAPDDERTILVTSGAEPTRVLQSTGTEAFAVASVAAVDTTGAGDSFNAGFLASHLSGASVAEAVAQGHKLAARVVTHHGALIPKEG